MKTTETFGARLLRLRTAEGLTQRGLVARTSIPITPGYISRLELGERMASPEIADALADALGIDPHYFATGDDTLTRAYVSWADLEAGAAMGCPTCLMLLAEGRRPQHGDSKAA